jgi:FkbM family methyltransferase
MRYYCTYFDRNYFVKALALIGSLSRHEKNPYRIYVVCLDEITRLLLTKLNMPGVEPIALHDIERGDVKLAEAKKARTLVEYYWTLTPTVLFRIFEAHTDIDVLTYLDADLFFYSSPDPIYQELGTGSVLIHEHRYAPTLKHLEGNGRFNVGLLCFRSDDIGLSAVSWWRDRCNEWCFWRYEDGKMGDQKYLDDWPQRFKNLVILKNPGAGLAPWNHIQYRFITDSSGRTTVDGSDLVFYHFHSLFFISPSIVIPARHVHYPLTMHILRACFIPYIERCMEAIKTIRSVMPDFSFGLEEKNMLSQDHTFLAHRELLKNVDIAGIPQKPAGEINEWRVYASAQLVDEQSAQNAPLPEIQIQELWAEGRPVTTSDDLLKELDGRPIAREIRTLYIVGAHLFQEQKLLFSLFPNLDKIYLFEPIPQAVQQLRLMTQNNPKIEVFGYAIADANGPLSFHLTDNNGESSSLLPLGTHKQIFPWVHEAATISVEAHVLDDVIQWHGLREPDMLFLDVQGAEYRILSTLSAKLRSRVKLIYTECSKEEIYQGAKLLEDVKTLLTPDFVFAGFAPLMQMSPTHGNALFAHRLFVNALEKLSPFSVRPGPQSATMPSQSVSQNSNASRDLLHYYDAVDPVENFNAIAPRTFAYLDENPDDETVLKRFIETHDQYLDKELSRSEIVDTNYKRKEYALSAVVSTYNSEEFIRECLTDLENQTIADMVEIIVIDAASPQNERRTVEEFQKSYTNIVYVRTPARIGVYPAWNLGIRKASAKFVTPFSTNDRLAPNAYETLYKTIIDKPDVALVYGDSYLTDVPHETFAKHTSSKFIRDMIWQPYSYESLLQFCMVGPHPIWRKEVHQLIGYFDGRYLAIGDQDFWLRMGRHYKLLHIPQFTGLVWYTRNSLSGDQSAINEIQAIHSKYQKIYLKEHGKLPDNYIDVEKFMTTITQFVEKNEKENAIEYYQKYRSGIPQSPELLQFDGLMEKLKLMVKR